MDAWICDAQRTPIGRYGGALSGVRADDLAAAPIAALIARNPDLDWARVDDVVLGCTNQAGEDNRNVARMAGLLAWQTNVLPLLGPVQRRCSVFRHWAKARSNCMFFSARRLLWMCVTMQRLILNGPRA